jgi:uncharacterized protein YecT (DUF1311 family)
MHLKILLLASTLFALATLPLSAQTQIEMTGEAGNKLSQAEQGMDKVYARLMAKISPDSGKMLRTAQQTWRRFRDEECTFDTRMSVGGSVHRMVEMNCQAGLTAERTRQLEYQLNCREGDFSCSQN